MGYDIDGNVALVTASSSGLGKAASTALAREGTAVMLNGRNEDRLEEAAVEIREETGGTVEICVADIANADDVDRTVTAFGGLDHLVLSAGGLPGKRFFETTDDEWYDAFDPLVMSVVRVVREAAQHLRADGGGTIVNVTSHVAKEANPANVLSSSVRTSVHGLVKTLSKELAPNVRSTP